MKLMKCLYGIFAILLVLSVYSFAQEQEKMKKEDWQNEMNRLNEEKKALKQEDSTVNAAINNLKSNPVENFDDCMNSLYQMVGATKADVDNFRAQVNQLDGQISRKEGPKADRQATLDQLRHNKISALPEFFDKVQNQMPRAMDAWVEKAPEKDYTVVRGDCLWNIAKKPDIYANAFAWPKIYQANRDQIKNPDLIYPKQIFKIPNLTEDEKAKYDKLRKNYKPAPPQQSSTQKP
jgi:nucleoid-associated protein YgaU